LTGYAVTSSKLLVSIGFLFSTHQGMECPKHMTELSPPQIKMHPGGYTESASTGYFNYGTIVWNRSISISNQEIDAELLSIIRLPKYIDR
jgi:hypothetical protein